MYGMNYSGKDAEAFYVRTPYQKRVYNPAYYWFPIHQSEMDKTRICDNFHFGDNSHKIKQNEK